MHGAGSGKGKAVKHVLRAPENLIFNLDQTLRLSQLESPLPSMTGSSTAISLLSRLLSGIVTVIESGALIRCTVWIGNRDAR